MPETWRNKDSTLFRLLPRRQSFLHSCNISVSHRLQQHDQVEKATDIIIFTMIKTRPVLTDSCQHLTSEPGRRRRLSSSDSPNLDLRPQNPSRSQVFSGGRSAFGWVKILLDYFFLLKLKLVGYLVKVVWPPGGTVARQGCAESTGENRRGHTMDLDPIPRGGEGCWQKKGFARW